MTNFNVFTNLIFFVFIICYFFKMVVKNGTFDDIFGKILCLVGKIFLILMIFVSGFGKLPVLTVCLKKYA